MSDPAARRLVVVGAGIAGLAAARFAAESGFAVAVLEASPAIGGKLRIAEVAGQPVDVGAEALLTTRPEGVELLDAVGLADERISPLTTSAHLRAAGRTVPLPAKTIFGVPGSVDAVRQAGVLSEQGLDVLAAEPALKPLPPLSEDVSVGQLVRERMGAEVVDRLVEPLLAGVYAGRADDLSLRATIPRLAQRLAEGGSLLQAAAAVAAAGTRAPSAGPVFTSLRGGLGRLPAAVAAASSFEVRLAVTVRAVRRTASGFALECARGMQRELVEADAVVVAVPAAKAARMLTEVAPTAAAELAGIESASMAIVTFAFDGVALPPGSGLLVAAGERLATKGITLSSQKWPLAHPGRVYLRASVGRIGESEALRLDDDELRSLVQRELGPMLGITGEPVDALVTRWGGGLPQYNVGHVERIARVRAALAQVPGLAACGAAFDGVGIPACIASARAAVDQVAAALAIT